MRLIKDANPLKKWNSIPLKIHKLPSFPALYIIVPNGANFLYLHTYSFPPIGGQTLPREEWLNQ